MRLAAGVAQRGCSSPVGTAVGRGAGDRIDSHAVVDIVATVGGYHLEWGSVLCYAVSFYAVSLIGACVEALMPFPKLNRRRFLSMGAAAAGGALVYARFLEPYWLQITHRRMPIAGLPAALVGKKVVHATDLHISPDVPDDYIRRVFDTIRDISPDFVLYTGDYVSSHSDLKVAVPQVLDTIAQGSLGTFAVLGNHDYGPGFDDEAYAREVIALLETRDVQVLRNRWVDCHGLSIVGIDDLWASNCHPELALMRLPASAPSIALLHNPDGVELDRWAGFSSWILCGHTHGGQCRLPWLPPPRLPIHHRKYASGAFKLTGNRSLYVSRGVGHSRPVRFCARPEIAVFELAEAG